MKITKKFMYILLLLAILPESCRRWREEHTGTGASYQDATHFSFIGLGMANYIDANGKMPSNITDKEGKPLLSWRVVLLKNFEPELYKQFKLDEPWNSPHNLKVAQTVPFMFIDPKGPRCTPLSKEEIIPLWRMDPKAPNYTPYLGVTGQTAAFRPDKPRVIAKGIPDRAAIVIVDKSDVFWTEPRDISLEKAKKGDTLRWYGEKMTRYLTTRGVPGYWEKDVAVRSDGERNEPPNYEFESDE